MIEVAPAFQRYFERLGWTDYPGVMRQFTGESLPRIHRTFVSSHRLSPGQLNPQGGDAVDVFYKHYQFKTPTWTFIGRPSKARCEFRNYQVFEQLNIPTAEAIACGEDRDALGRLHGAFIITRAIPGAVTLRELFENKPNPLNRALRRELLHQLANSSRRLHEAGFCHNDMVWRNLLVTWPSPKSVKLWWIDCPRGRWVRWHFSRRRKQIKDLAALDKSAFLFCRQTDRLRFLLEYLGQRELDGVAKSWIRDVTKFGRKRWPDDWVKPGVSQ